jgi:hypothetical protein
VKQERAGVPDSHVYKNPTPQEGSNPMQKKTHSRTTGGDTSLPPPQECGPTPLAPPRPKHGPHFLVLLHTCQSQIAWPSPPCSLYRSIPSALVGWVGGGRGGKGGRVSRSYAAGWVCLLCLSSASEAHKDLIACSTTHLPVPPLCRGDTQRRNGLRLICYSLKIRSE